MGEIIAELVILIIELLASAGNKLGNPWKKATKSFRRQKHEFDLDKPVFVEADLARKDKDGNWNAIMVEGYTCTKCDKTLWLSKGSIQSLPKPMCYCDDKIT